MNRTITEAAGEYYGGNREPRLSEMLTDPVFLAVLRRDGLTAADLCGQLGLPKKLASGSGGPCAPVMAAA